MDIQIRIFSVFLVQQKNQEKKNLQLVLLFKASEQIQIHVSDQVKKQNSFHYRIRSYSKILKKQIFVSQMFTFLQVILTSMLIRALPSKVVVRKITDSTREIPSRQETSEISIITCLTMTNNIFTVKTNYCFYVIKKIKRKDQLKIVRLRCPPTTKNET